MKYQLIKKEIDEDPHHIFRTTGEDVFLDNLRFDYKVYLFYYPSIFRNTTLENRLRELGNLTENNLFVNISSLRDPKYNTITKMFNIKKTPVIIITAIDELAAGDNFPFTHYIRLDDENLFNSIPLLEKCINSIFQLFLQNKIKQAINEYQRSTIKIKLNKVIKRLNTIAGEIKTYFEEKDIEIEMAPFKLSLKNK